MVVLFEIVEVGDSTSEFSIVDILIKNCSYYYRQTSESEIVESDVKIIKESLT